MVKGVNVYISVSMMLWEIIVSGGIIIKGTYLGEGMVFRES